MLRGLKHKETRAWGGQAKKKKNQAFGSPFAVCCCLPTLDVHSAAQGPEARHGALRWDPEVAGSDSGGRRAMCIPPVAPPACGRLRERCHWKAEPKAACQAQLWRWGMGHGAQGSGSCKLDAAHLCCQSCLGRIGRDCGIEPKKIPRRKPPVGWFMGSFHSSSPTCRTKLSSEASDATPSARRARPGGHGPLPSAGAHRAHRRRRGAGLSGDDDWAGTLRSDVAMVQNQWYRDWDVHWGYGVLTHGCRPISFF